MLLFASMKLLRITTSEDTEARVPEEERTPWVAARRFTELTGEPMEMVHRIFWPTAEFPDIVDSWLAKHSPDAVFMIVSSYAFTYESVPLRVERRLGKAGTIINRRSQQPADNHTIADNATFRAVRKTAFRAIGGETNFTPREVLDRTEAVIRHALKHEDMLMMIRGPRRPLAVDGGARSAQRAERKRKMVNRNLQALCERNHVPLHIFEQPPFGTERPDLTFGDGIHTTTPHHAVEGKLQGEFMAEAWQRHSQP